MVRNQFARQMAVAAPNSGASGSWGRPPVAPQRNRSRGRRVLSDEDRTPSPVRGRSQTPSGQQRSHSPANQLPNCASASGDFEEPIRGLPRAFQQRARDLLAPAPSHDSAPAAKGKLELELDGPEAAVNTTEMVLVTMVKMQASHHTKMETMMQELVTGVKDLTKAMQVQAARTSGEGPARFLEKNSLQQLCGPRNKLMRRFCYPITDNLKDLVSHLTFAQLLT